MNVLLLTPRASELIPALLAFDDTFIIERGPINCKFVKEKGIEFIISYGYRHLIDSDIIRHLEYRVINMHISMLPKSRGAHPNFWSIVEGSTSGFTIHLVDSGLDTGNILIQQEVSINHSIDTFRTSYERLSQSVERAFCLNWKYLRTGSTKGWVQLGEATYHRACEMESLKDFLPQGWDTPIRTYFELASNEA